MEIEAAIHRFAGRARQNKPFRKSVSKDIRISMYSQGLARKDAKLHWDERPRPAFSNRLRGQPEDQDHPSLAVGPRQSLYEELSILR
ncbi:hypothetical protein YTPLAS18_39280 [Nitrospira sp.]|nr:hypothetical protein YTPLAS18_39280 [Nitrospira sp.]